jgi:PrcB C-terminal
MTRSVRIVSVCVLALSAACGGSDLTQPPGTSLPMVRLRSEAYSFTFYSGLDKPARLVVRDAVTWRVIWNQIYLRQSPVPPLPPIDFSREMMVVVALGSHSTGGYSILLDGAAEAAKNGIAVIVDSSSPGSNCIVTEAFTQPVDIARVPLRDGAVSFVERTHVSDCG